MHELDNQILEIFRFEIKKEYYDAINNMMGCTIDMNCGTILRPINHLHLSFKAMPRSTMSRPLPEGIDYDAMLSEEVVASLG
jgi:hypothetical protein